MFPKPVKMILCLGLLGISVGCRTGNEDVIGPFPAVVQGQNFTAEELASKVALSPVEKYSSVRVAELREAEVYAIQTTGEVKLDVQESRDQLFFIVKGKCISNVRGTRDVVGPGSTIVVPRGVPVHFIRGEKDEGRPLLMVQILAPNEGFTERPSLPAPKLRPQPAE